MQPPQVALVVVSPVTPAVPTIEASVGISYVPAVGTVAGGIIGDRIGRKLVIWVSILG